MSGSEPFIVIRWIIRAARTAFWLYRKVGPSDYAASVAFLTVPMVVCIYVVLVSLSVVDFHASFLPQWRDLSIAAIAMLGLGACAFCFLYVFRLRKLGIAGADAEIDSGLDYKSALKMIDDGFDFIGISGAKLSSHRAEFEQAIEKCAKKNQSVRLLLCHPKAVAIGRLESLAGVYKGRYLTTAQQSFTLLAGLKDRFGDNLKIRFYNPANESELPPLRMMFINSSLCLASPNVPGAAREGRVLPQLHVAKSAIGNEPTLFSSLEKMFEQAWLDGADVSSATFVEIAQLK